MQGAALEEIEKLSLYEELLESMERVVYHLNLVSGSFEYISGAASSLFGLDPERVRDSGMELVGKHMVPGDYEAAMERIAEAAAGNPGRPGRTRTSGATCAGPCRARPLRHVAAVPSTRRARPC